MKRENEAVVAYAPKKDSLASKILVFLGTAFPAAKKSSEIIAACKSNPSQTHTLLYRLTTTRGLLRYKGRDVGYNLTQDGWRVYEKLWSTRARSQTSKASKQSRGGQAAQTLVRGNVMALRKNLSALRVRSERLRVMKKQPASSTTTTTGIAVAVADPSLQRLHDFADYHPDIFNERQSLVARIKIIDDFIAAWGALRKEK